MVEDHLADIPRQDPGRGRGRGRDRDLHGQGLRQDPPGRQDHRQDLDRRRARHARHVRLALLGRGPAAAARRLDRPDRRVVVPLPPPKKLQKQEEELQSIREVAVQRAMAGKKPENER